MKPLTRRKLITTGIAATAGVTGLDRCSPHRRTLRPHSSRSHRTLRPRRDAHLRLPAPSHQAFARPRVPSQHDLEVALRQRDRASQRSASKRASDHRLLRLASCSRRYGRPPRIALARRPQEHCPSAARSPRSPAKKAGPTSPSGSERLSSRFSTPSASFRRHDMSSTSPSRTTGGTASTWPTLSIHRRCSPGA